jgi:uncharacterized protein YeeX (DUF496 family)
MKPIRLIIPVVISSVLALSACGSVPPAPTEKLAIVQNAIINAKNEEAHTYATMDLMKAEQKLEDAKKLIAEEKMDAAERKLDQALQDAELAKAKADSARAAKQAEEMSNTVETLKQEVNR